jgi:hypothetical protein
LLCDERFDVRVTEEFVDLGELPEAVLSIHVGDSTCSSGRVRYAGQATEGLDHDDDSTRNAEGPPAGVGTRRHRCVRCARPRLARDALHQRRSCRPPTRRSAPSSSARSVTAARAGWCRWALELREPAAGEPRRCGVRRTGLHVRTRDRVRVVAPPRPVGPGPGDRGSPRRRRALLRSHRHEAPHLHGASGQRRLARRRAQARVRVRGRGRAPRSDDPPTRTGQPAR